MRPAPVGFQCPDDVAAGSASSRRTVNPLGGPSGRRPAVVTWALLALNVVGFVLEGFPLGGLSGVPNEFVRRFITYNPAVPDEPWRLLTGAFLHDGIVHIGLNMVALVLLGTQLEQILGWARYLALYVTSALGGGALFYLLGGPGSQLGASAAIFGMFSAFFLVARRLRVDSSSILATIGINLVLTVLIPGISLWGHLGGLVTGAVLGLVYTGLPARPAFWQAVQIGVAGALAVVLVLVSQLPVGAA